MTYRAADEYEAMFARWHARKELERQQEAEHVQELRTDLRIKMAAIERKQSRRRAAHRVVMGLMVGSIASGAGVWIVAGQLRALISLAICSAISVAIYLKFGR